MDLPTALNRHALSQDGKWFAPQLHLRHLDCGFSRPAQLTVVFNLHDGEQPEPPVCSLIFAICTAVYLCSHLISLYMAHQGFSRHSTDAMCLYSCVGQLVASASNGLRLDSHDIEAVGAYFSAAELFVIACKKSLPRNSPAYDARSRLLALGVCGAALFLAAGLACAERFVFDRHLPLDASLWAFLAAAGKAFQALIVLPQVVQTSLNAKLYHVDVIGIWGRLFAVWVYAAVLCLGGQEHVCRWQVFARDGLAFGVVLLQYHWLHRHGSKYK